MVVSMDRWRGKVAIVTGASAGIGAAIAGKLVEEGLLVVGLARRSELVEELANKLHDKKGKLYALKTDISKEEDILKAFKWTSDNLGPVHILINNAGVIQAAKLTDSDTETWKRVFDTNVLGLCIATREAVKIMKTNNIDGHILHINSVAGHNVSNGHLSNVYAASKYAVTALTETLRQELNHLGLKIKVSSVSPGVVETDIFQIGKFDFDINTFFNAALQSEDIADGVIYVLSTPPHVQVHFQNMKSKIRTTLFQVHELTIKPVGEVFL